MGQLYRTVFYDKHVKLGAKMVEFGGWEMPIQYPTGIVQEHLATRKGAGLFDVSHMGRIHSKRKRQPAVFAARTYKQRRRPRSRPKSVHNYPQRNRRCNRRRVSLSLSEG